MSENKLPNARDRQMFMRAMKCSAAKIIGELGRNRVAAEVENVDVEGIERVIDLCFIDRNAMKVFTFMLNNGELGFNVSECAAVLGIPEDVAEAYLQAFADAGLIDQSVR